MPKAKIKLNWLDRRIAAPGPYLTLVLSQEEFDSALESIGVKERPDFVSGPRSHATVHYCDNKEGNLCCIVALKGWETRDPIETAGLLVHEAVHIWQQYAASIGEKNPGDEQEAYAIQSISQELMAEFARRIGGRR